MKKNFDLIGSIVCVFIYSLNSTTLKLLVPSSLEIEHGARLQQAASLLSSNLKKTSREKVSHFIFMIISQWVCSFLKENLIIYIPFRLHELYI